MVCGTRQVLIIAFGAGFASTAIAAIIGVAAAYLGGAWDGVLGLFTDVLLVIPLFPLLIVIAAYVHSSGTLVLIAVLTLTGWSYTARQLRSQALATEQGLPRRRPGSAASGRSTSSASRSCPR